MHPVPQMVKTAVVGVAALLCAIVALSAERPLGMVTVAQNARVDTADATLGANVYAGDALNTSDGGTLRLRIGSGQLYIMGDTNAVLASDGDRVDARVMTGTAGFSATASDPLEIETPVGVLRPADNSRAFGQATITGPQKALIAVYEGTLLLSRSGEELELAAGKSYSISLAPTAAAAAPVPAADPTPQAPQGSGTGHRSKQWIVEAILVGGAAAGGYGVWEWLTESSSTPHH